MKRIDINLVKGKLLGFRLVGSKEEVGKDINKPMNSMVGKVLKLNNKKG